MGLDADDENLVDAALLQIVEDLRAAAATECRLRGNLAEKICQSGRCRAQSLWVLLRRAHAAFAQAQKCAHELNLRGIATWSDAQAIALYDLARSEAECAGYAVRAKALRSWADLILS